MRFFYTFVLYCALPLVLLRLVWRSFAVPAYAKRWAERFGFFEPPVAHKSGTHKKVIWLHTVSVGEFIATLPLIRELQKKPELRLVITTTTTTGSERVRAVLGDSVFHVYAPYDLPDVIERFIDRVKPSVLCIMETELWPNTLAICAQHKIPSVLVNGRMSEKSARGYAMFSRITSPMLRNLSLALVQNKDDATRMHHLGLPVKNTYVTGNIKFDLMLSDELREQAKQLKNSWSHSGERIIWIAASTHQGEDEIILDAFAQVKNQLSNVLLILVPRHPERFASVESLSLSRGFTVSKRSSSLLDTTTDIILGDTMGELLLLFGASDIAFIGGSLVAKGGHNFIEAAAWQLPLLSGVHLFNFAEVSRLLQVDEGLTLINSASELAEQIKLLAINEAERTKRGLAALKVANDNRGALQKTLTALQQFIG